MIELGPQGQEKLFIEQGRKDPLMAKDIGHGLGIILMPPTAGDLLARLLNQRVIEDKKNDIPDTHPQCLKELIKGGLGEGFHRPKVLSQESSKAREGAVQKRMGKALNHGRRVNLSSQLDEADDKTRKEFKGRS